MNITVLGLWHLGCVTAACCAKYFSVIGLDFDISRIEGLRQGRAPLWEPGLDDLIQIGNTTHRLSFTDDIDYACAQADVLWVCHDTPVDENDVADVEWVLEDVRRALHRLRAGTVVLLSSQLPVGTCGRLEQEFAEMGFYFACAPENLRLGRALDVFLHPERIVIGVRDAVTREKLQPLFAPFSENLVWMSPESAEITKHGINGFLALSVAYMNEVARVCEAMGADAKEVEIGLKTDARIGSRAYLSPGAAFSGGTLARDVVTMTQLAQNNGLSLQLIPTILTSNEEHKSWALKSLQRELRSLSGTTIAVLGLTYKPGTDTLRRSSAVELCHVLLQEGCCVRAFDPAVRVLTHELQGVTLCNGVLETLCGADAAVLCTAWPEFQNMDWETITCNMKQPFIVDAERFLSEVVEGIPGLRYLSVGLAR